MALRTTSSLYKQGFRKLLKVATVVFKNDTFALAAARSQLREEFYSKRHETDEAKLEALRSNIEEVHHMLQYNIVQGTKNKDTNHFDVGFRPDHHETIAAGQHLQHGPELEPIDPSFVGVGVKINKSTGYIDNSRGTTPQGGKREI